MDIHKLNDFVKGWIIGSFEPTLLKTPDFEVAVKRYQKGDKETKHFHKVAREYTVVVSGRYLMNEQVLQSDDVVVIEPGEHAEFECLEDGATCVIKTPSALDDKFIVGKNPC